ncbi:MAG TPA: NAD(P)H-hydrate dehydratase [Candidatus Dormibacteraeota bacterium]|nr:NAD(P)H-hydrate dehydratase [Candidatus Dormibacteraeota bacterium]
MLTGVDVTSVARIARAVRDGRFRARVFTSAEQAECGAAMERWATRWAAKEAVRKLAGAAGERPLPAFRDIEVVRPGGGAPRVLVRGAPADVAISLSHEGDMAVAVAVAMPGAAAGGGLHAAPLQPVPERWFALPERRVDAHKGTFGTVVVVGGSPGLSGAPYLAAMGAARTGAGRIRLCVPAALHPAMVVKCVEVMPHALPDGGRGVLGGDATEQLRSSHLPAAQALVVGPGIGLDPATGEALVALLDGLPCPVVVDADGLTLAAREGLEWRRAGAPVVVTPHPAEMARLLGGGTAVADVARDRPAVAARYAVERGVVVVLKGAWTVVAAPDGRLWTSPYAVPALATGGTGDVLGGVCGALLAAGIAGFEAAVTAVTVHAEAGAELEAARGRAGILASDLLEHLPVAQERLRRAWERGDSRSP